MSIKAIQKTYIGWILFFVLALSSTSLLAPTIAGAQDKKDLCTGANLTFDTNKNSCTTEDGVSSTKGGKQCVDSAGNTTPCGENELNSLIATIVNIFSIVVGIAAVLMIIYGGFRYITSGGDSGNVTSAKNTIIYAIVGLIIVAFAQFIVKFILSKLT